MPFQSGAVAAMLRSVTAVRPGRLDLALTALAATFAAVLGVGNVEDPEVQASWAAVPGMVAIALTLLARSRAPLAALAAALAVIAVNVAALGTAVRCGLVFPLEFLLVFSAAARLPRRQALAGLALALAGVTVMMLGDGAVGPGNMPFFLPLTAAVWALGRLVHSRSVLVEELQARTSELRRMRDDRARLEVATDRARLSGELDRLLQRRLGELGTLARAGEGELDPDGAEALLQAIEHRSRRTLDEMRAVVGALREEGGAAPTAPARALEHLEGLLRRAAGAPVALEIEGSPRVLPAGVELSAYRVVEQLLTVLDAADDLRVRVAFADDALELAVTGPLRRRTDAGPALDRARERVELHRGTFHATTRRGRAEAIAHLPVALAGT
jgi:signal transduction histidine kinase